MQGLLFKFYAFSVLLFTEPQRVGCGQERPSVFLWPPQEPHMRFHGGNKWTINTGEWVGWVLVQLDANIPIFSLYLGGRGERGVLERKRWSCDIATCLW